ncbi:MAG: STAS/SEC14 domain-containing protein [Opitutales bacterium]
MSDSENRLNVQIDHGERGICLRITAVGKLTHEDYELLSPLIEDALSGVDEPSIYALIDARRFEGWELKALWDDLKLGAAHGREFKRVAVLGHQRWQVLLSKVAKVFVAGETRFFTDESEAWAWLGV